MKLSKFEHIFTWILRGSLFVASILFFVNGDVANGIGSILAFGISLLPIWIEERFRFKLPWETEIFIALVLVAHMILGEGFRFYDHFPYYDKILHMSNSIGIAIFVFIAGYALYFAARPNLNMTFAIITVFFITLGIGALWEIAEYAGDRIFGFSSQGSPIDDPLTDTMKDLIYDMLGGALGAISTAIFIKRERKFSQNSSSSGKS